MKKVYICSPYRGDTETNVENARKYCRATVELSCLPIAPHLLYPQFLDDDNPRERERGMIVAHELIFMCEELWAFGLDDPSEGMREEIRWAKDAGVPVLDGFEMIGESKRKSTIADASDNELVGELLSRIRDGRIEIVTEVHQGGSSVHFEVRK